MNKQCICPECGRIAEVRRRSNGQHLRYIVCKEGHGGLHTQKDAKKWEEVEQDHIGEFGSFPDDTSLEAATEQQPPQGDYEPAITEQVTAEPSETAETNQSDEPEESESGLPLFAKIGLGLLGLAGIGGMAFMASKKRASL